MPVITVADVRAICSVAASDAAIELNIETVNDQVGACLDVNYTPAVAKLIAIYTVAHFADKGGSSSAGGLKSRTWADGSSESYDTGGVSSNSSSFWDAATQYDSEGCLAIFGDVTTPDGVSPVFVVTGSTAKAYDEAQ